MRPIPMGLFLIAVLLAIVLYQNKEQAKELTRTSKAVAIWGLATYAVIVLHLI